MEGISCTGLKTNWLRLRGMGKECLLLDIFHLLTMGVIENGV
jgi:hypothetical protein